MADGSAKRTPEGFYKSYSRAAERHPTIAGKIKDNLQLKIEQLAAEAEAGRLDKNIDWYGSIAHLF